MAFKEVTIEEFDKRTFAKFEAIGDKHAGIFVDVKSVNGKYGPKNEWSFKNKTGSFTITAPYDLEQKLLKAGLAPGFRVIMEYTGNRDVGRDSPMKVFKVLVDDGTPEEAPF